VIFFAKENGIMMLCLPPHCTHGIQLLDVSFYGPIKTCYDQEASKWLKANPGRTVTQYQISSFSFAACGKAAAIGNAESSFRKTGIWPVNAEIFEDLLFALADITHMHIPNPNEDKYSNPRPSGDAPCSSSAFSEAKQSEKRTIPSTNQEDTHVKISSIVTREGRKYVPIQTISPVPLVVRKRKRKQFHFNLLY
jgi:hypothetical protein